MKFAADMWSDLILAPLVVMQRLPVIWTEAFLPYGGRPESRRMVDEKMAAVLEGVVAAQVEVQLIMIQSAIGAMSGIRPPGPVTTTARLAQAALRPSAKRVKANVRRLSRR